MSSDAKQANMLNGTVFGFLRIPLDSSQLIIYTIDHTVMPLQDRTVLVFGIINPQLQRNTDSVNDTWLRLASRSRPFARTV